MAKKKWIKQAIKRPGAFTAKAKKGGMNVQAYARHIRAKDGKRFGRRTLRQAILAQTLKKIGGR